MIIYISSYPRSGSSLMQQIVNTFFEHPWSEMDLTSRPLNKITGVPEYFTNWRYDPQILLPERSLWGLSWNKINRHAFKIYNIERWLALYDLNIPPYTKNCLYLLPGCKDALTLQNRRKLANQNSYYFVKTHHLPFKKYLNHEYVIQITRHPGLVFISYDNFIRDYDSNDNKTINDVIEGKVPFGSWSYWHECWNRAASNLENRFLRLKFEDIVAAEKSKVCEQIKELTGLDYNHHKQELSFNDLNRTSPKYYRSGQSNNWQKKYTEPQLNRIYELHGTTFRKMGFV